MEPQNKKFIDMIDTIILKALDMRIKELEENFKILESRVDDLEDDIGRIKRG
jgi:hypothetical protein